MNYEKPLLSVVVVTYNHEKYIAQCLESLISQETKFHYEIIVGDDCSTDSTQEIISDYQKKYPNIIKPIFQETNTLNVDKKNFSDVISAALGKYIAFVDGDDFSFPDKLKEQVDFMEKHDNVGICHHKMEMIYNDSFRWGRKKYTHYPHKENIISLCEYSTNLNCIYHSSKIFRSDLIPSKGLCFDTDKNALDYVWIMQLLIQSNSMIGYLEKPLGGYRVGVGVATSKGYAVKGKRGHMYAIQLLDDSSLCNKRTVNYLRSITMAGFARINLQLNFFNEFVTCLDEANDYFPLKKMNKLYYILKHYPSILSFMFKLKNRFYF
ncbi:MAG: glycosyltransferase [gamma proteobacterium symbiont of Lucinoma myriamae]|nr:glycosyltransferase [gamma proteobacterium symbiont of Lucinoma myriamae]